MKKDKIEVFQKENKELFAQEVDLDLKRINLSDLGESIKPRILGLLEPIINGGVTMMEEYNFVETSSRNLEGNGVQLRVVNFNRPNKHT